MKLKVVNLCLCSFLLFSLLFPLHVNACENNVPFEKNYAPLWGYQNVKVLNRSMEVQLTFDQQSGSGFQSLGSYDSGWFSMNIKLPQKDSTAVITTFYFISDNGNTRDEIDFEFLGAANGTSDILHTNIFTNGQGGREQQIFLWFDPTTDFHNYTLLWNEKQIAFFVDDIPIRVFKNTTDQGGNYPTKALKITGTMWTGPWVANGVPPNWNDGPFEAHYRGFGISGCSNQNQECDSWWNAENYWTLNPSQKEAYNNIRSKYLYYDYCSKKTQSLECQN